MSEFVLLYVGLYVALCQTLCCLLLTCPTTITDNMVPAEGVYTILGRWKTAASNCVEALRSPPHRCKCRRRSGVAVLKRKSMHCFMSSYLHLSNKTIDLPPFFSLLSSHYIYLHFLTRRFYRPLLWCFMSSTVFPQGQSEQIFLYVRLHTFSLFLG